MQTRTILLLMICHLSNPHLGQKERFSILKKQAFPEVSHVTQKGTSRQISGKGAIRKKDSHSKNRGGKKNGTYTMKTYRKPNEQLFSQ